MRCTIDIDGNNITITQWGADWTRTRYTDGKLTTKLLNAVKAITSDIEVTNQRKEELAKRAGRQMNIYPFKDMKVGGVEMLNFTTDESQARVRNAAAHYGKRNNKKFKSEVVCGGIEITRTA